MKDSGITEGCRLNRYLARSGVASRRKSDDLIRRGYVTVNGRTVTSPGFRVMDGDRVTFEGSEVRPLPKVTVILNKPHGYETTMAGDSQRGVSRLMRGLPPGTVPVGRLDVNTGGLLILSNDGELVNRLTHPSWEVEREYRVFLPVPPDDNLIRRLGRGARIGPGEFSRPSSVRRSGSRSVSIVIHTGRNREVRRLFDSCGIPFTGLERTRYGPLSIQGIKRGSWRELSAGELRELRASVGLEKG